MGAFSWLPEPVKRAGWATQRGLRTARRFPRSEPISDAVNELRWRTRELLAPRGITHPHYFNFGAEQELVGGALSRQGWDALRTAGEGPYTLPETREEWRRVADAQTEVADRARSIDEFLAAEEIESLASYGVGSASLEYWLNLLSPQRRLLLGEYTPATVSRLEQVFPEAEVHHHDLLRDPPLPAQIHLLHRVDTEFDDDEWGQIMERFRSARLLIVVPFILDWRRVRSEEDARRSGGAYCGICRNARAMKRLWKPTHKVARKQFGDLPGWVLEPKR